MLTIFSFSYRDNDTPDGIVFDCRNLRNPYRNTNLRQLTGLSLAVKQYVLADPNAVELVDEAFFTVDWNAVHYKALQTIAFGCTGGQHRSVTLAETLYDLIADPTNTNLEHLNLKGNTK